MAPVLIAKNTEKRGRQWYSAYLCRCGSTFVALKGNITSGGTSSCGCVKRAMVAAKNTTHGLSKDIPRLYSIWKSIRTRCNPITGHPNYGKRGISMCQEWADYNNFHLWATNNGYNCTLSIDRINVNGNYEPSNCRWATDLEQAQNTRKSIGIKAAQHIREIMHGVERRKGCGVKALAEQYGVCRSTIKKVLRNETYPVAAPHEMTVRIDRP